MKADKTLIFLLVLVVIAVGILGWMMFQLNSSKMSSVPGNVVVNEEKNESGYYFDDSYNYNLTKSVTGVLESVTDSMITISNSENNYSYQFNADAGFLLYCLPSNIVTGDGQIVRNSEVFLDYSRLSSEGKKQLVRASKNVSISDKLLYLSENFIGNDIALALNQANSLIESVNVYSDDLLICNKFNAND